MAWRSEDIKVTLFKSSTVPLGKFMILKRRRCARSSGCGAQWVGSFERAGSESFSQRVKGIVNCNIFDKQPDLTRKRAIHEFPGSRLIDVHFDCIARDYHGPA